MLKKILGLLSGTKSTPVPEAPKADYLSKLLNNLVKEVGLQAGSYYYDAPVAACETYKIIKSLDEDQKIALLWLVAQTLAGIVKKESRFADLLNHIREGERPEKERITEEVCKALQKLLLREKWPMTEEEYSRLVFFYNENFDKGQWYSGHPANELIQKAAVILGGHAPSPSMRITLLSLMVEEGPYTYNDIKKRNQKIQLLVDGGNGMPVDKNDLLGAAMLDYYNSLSPGKKEHWSTLLRLCFNEGSKGAPSARWIKEADVPVLALKEELKSCLKEWLGLCENRLREIHRQEGYAVNYLRDANIAIFKGLLWCCPSEADIHLQEAITCYVVQAYKKKTGVGSISMATGTAGLWNLSRLPVKEGIPRLLAVRNRVSNNTILKSIDKLLREAAEKSNLHPQEMEEIACPDYGMKQVGVWEKVLGDFRVVIREKKFQAVLSFEKNGKEMNSVPAALKNEFAEELKSIKVLQKNISEQIRTHADRLENSFLHNRSWTFENWKSLYIDHPLLAIAGRRIIWHFNTGSEKYEAIYHNGEMVQANGSPLPVPGPQTQVSLWHPIGFDSSYIVQWRNWLRHHEIQQPFKQAFREVYLLTDAELRTDTYSNRYAAHIIRQHQFNALAKLRGWSYQRMGQWDSHNHPIRNLPWLDIYVEWFVDADWNGEASDSGIYNYIMTDQVRFYRNGQLLHLYDVPAMVFSEMMRDVDMFVGVCSIGNDPDWQDSGNAAANTYWRNYSFSDELSASAEIRKETLQHLIPRMKIAPQCSFDKKFLVVKGRLRTYKIHMGSGNILMEPNDQYLCIVPESGERKAGANLFIPFEGDRLLSIIISKALLLADDDRITDPTITRQIR